MVAAGHKASDTKGFDAEQEAAYKANDTRKGWKQGTTRSMHERPEFTCSNCFLVKPTELRSMEHLDPVCRDCE